MQIMRSSLRVGLAFLAALGCCVMSHAALAYSLNTSGWTDLGTGPLWCASDSGSLTIRLAYSDTVPNVLTAGVSTSFSGTDPRYFVPYASTNHSWALLDPTSAGKNISCQAGSNANSSGSSQANPAWQGAAGSTGTDYSVNASAIPASGLTLLQTIAANPSRLAIEVQNQSSNIAQVVRDDGAGNNQTSILLAGIASGSQGGGWSSNTFKGRVRIYGVSGSQIAAYQD